MKGLIVASVNQSSIKQSNGLSAEMIKYTPIMCENEKEIAPAFEKHFPNQTIMMMMNINILKENIKMLDKLAESKGIELS